MICRGRKDLRRRYRRLTHERHAHRDDTPEPVRTHQRGLPGNRRTPVIADDDSLFRTKRIDERHHVGHEIDDRIGAGLIRAFRSAITAHVGRHGMNARPCKCGDLMTPCMRCLGKPVAQQYQRPLARFGNVHPQGCCFDHALLHRCLLDNKPVALGKIASGRHRIFNSVSFYVTENGSQ